MVTAADFITLPYTADLTTGGIAYACRSLAHTYDRMGGSRFARMRRIVAGVAVELAFRRLLHARAVPHDVLGATPFTDPDRYDVALGGRRCDLKSALVLEKERIRQIRAAPETLLEAQALVPIDQMTSDSLQEGDLYIFAYLTALEAPTRETWERARAAGQPGYLVHPLPPEWSRPPNWLSLGELAFKGELRQAIELEVGGQDQGRAFQTATLTLLPGRRVPMHRDFFALTYLHVPRWPEARLGVYSPVLGKTHVARPEDWENIWVYGLEVVLAGYLSRREFRQRGRRLPRGRAAFPYRRTRTDNLAVPVRELRSLEDLFTRVKNFAA